MFKKIFIEKKLKDSPYAQQILTNFKNSELIEIEDYSDYFGRYKKPYLQKRESLNLFLGNKKGELVKEAPPAYGTKEELHYYYVHAYNCIYECNYCYLQGYFHSPDIVLFCNHDEIIAQMKNVLQLHENDNQKVWFHGGEFSDTLALSHLTGELTSYHKFFKSHPTAFWEIRTKSIKIKEIKKLEPIPNMIISFSMSPQAVGKKNDLRTPSTKARTQAISTLQKSGYQISIHLDPIIYSEDLVAQYTELIQQMQESVDLKKLQYLSIGVVRFSSDVYQQVLKNYPEANYLHTEFVKANDGKVKYPLAIRNWILNQVEHILIQAGVPEKIIYRCME